ncbi:hypothetical protein ACKFKG_18225 [Phormidesmis sp. 146-35]
MSYPDEPRIPSPSGRGVVKGDADGTAGGSDGDTDGSTAGVVGDAVAEGTGADACGLEAVQPPIIQSIEAAKPTHTP